MRAVTLIASLAAFLAAATPPLARAQSPAETTPLSHQSLKELGDIRKAIENLREMGDGVRRMTRKRRADCLLATGDEQFCKCLNDELPVALPSFQAYIAVITADPEEIGYTEMDADGRRIFDKTIEVRDRCVRERFDFPQTKTGNRR